MHKAKNTLQILLEEDYLNENVLIMILRLVHKIQGFKYINAIMLHFLILKVRNYNIRRVIEIEKIYSIKKVEKIEEKKGYKKLL